MDLLARKHLKKIHPHHFHAIPHEAWSIWHNGIKLSYKLFDIIYMIVHYNAAREYSVKKGSLKQSSMALIHWDSFKAAASSIPHRKVIIVTKHSSGMCSVSKFMKRWKIRD